LSPLPVLLPKLAATDLLKLVSCFQYFSPACADYYAGSHGAARYYLRHNLDRLDLMSRQESYRCGYHPVHRIGDNQYYKSLAKHRVVG
jgi:hypothetical protein